VIPYFETKLLSAAADATAPDGSEVRILLAQPAGSTAHFSLPPRAVSIPVRHRTISEIWYVISGQGQMWRSQDARTEVVDLVPGTALTIPVGTAFQFRSTSDESLTALGITMPPWPGDGEAEIVAGVWVANVEQSPRY
jgi:mannose-6-phosphate isomerase-like protein (cupin superfamily)